MLFTGGHDNGQPGKNDRAARRRRSADVAGHDGEDRRQQARRQRKGLNERYRKRFDRRTRQRRRRFARTRGQPAASTKQDDQPGMGEH